MNNRELAIKIIEELNNRLGTRLGGVAVMLAENILNDNAAQQPLAPDVCPVCLGKKLVQTKNRGVINCSSCNGTGQRR